jgi:hypothetical protein
VALHSSRNAPSLQDNVSSLNCLRLFCADRRSLYLRLRGTLDLDPIRCVNSRVLLNVPDQSVRNVLVSFPRRWPVYRSAYSVTPQNSRSNGYKDGFRGPIIVYDPEAPYKYDEEVIKAHFPR